MAPAPRPAPRGKPAGPSFRYQKRPIWVLAFYLPILVLPWIFTCILMYKPVGQSTYLRRDGIYTEEDVRHMERWPTAIDVLNRIAAVLGVPVVSTLVAHAAVRYSQRRTASQKLDLAQLFALADRRWTNISYVWKFATFRTPLLLLGFLLVFITVIQPPLQSVLVKYESTSVITCKDVPGTKYGAYYKCGKSYGASRQITLGYDPEPGDLENCPRPIVMQKLGHKISDVTQGASQSHLWPDEETRLESTQIDRQYRNIISTFRWYYSGLGDRGSFYASALPNGATTGVLRHHSLRQQSNASCEKVEQTSFPSTCSGDAPFTTAFLHDDLTVRICAPGSTEKVPWTLSRNRQDISEDLWIDLKHSEKRYRNRTFTLHCTSISTRGYFELGNVYNGNEPGPLLEKWPGPDDMAVNFNDLMGTWTDDYIPTEMAPAKNESSVIDNLGWIVPPALYYQKDMDDIERLLTPGPLMTATMALFGNTSFLFPAKNATGPDDYKDAYRAACRTTIPFSLFDHRLSRGPYLSGACTEANENKEEEYGDDYYEGELLNLVMGFFDHFRNVEDVNTMLDVTMFFANEILLTATATQGSYGKSRPIYTSSGYQITKPVRSIAAIAVISVLIGLQVAGLIWLAVYSCSAPTWTSKLDALAMAKVARESRDIHLTPLGVKDKKNDTEALTAADGIVGVVERDAETSTLSEAPPGMGLGATGVITRDMVPRKRKKGKGDAR